MFCDISLANSIVMVGFIGLYTTLTFINGRLYEIECKKKVLFYDISKFPLIISSFGMSTTETRRRREASVSDTEYSENEQDGEVNGSSLCFMILVLCWLVTCCSLSECNELPPVHC